MNWILEHLGALFPIAAGLAAWLIQRAANKKAEREGKLRPPPGSRPVADGEPFDDLSRRIQEEIRRKIEQRRQEIDPSQPAPPAHREIQPLPPVVNPRGPAAGRAREVHYDREQRTLREKAEARAAELRARVEAAQRERQNRLERARQAELEETAAAERATQLQMAAERSHALAALTARTESLATTSTSQRRAILDQLRDPRVLREAIILREVLGPPVALR